jgi:glycyl-tRNA synthetase beta chain
MSEFLLELLSEEIPARMQVQAAADLQRLVTEKLTTAGLTFDSAAAHSTPRRLTLVIDGLPDRSPDRAEERKGPKVGSPDGAIQGFLKSSGLASIDEAEIRETDKGPVYFAVTKIAGETTDTILASAISQVIASLPWPKSMKWGETRRKWVRPLHQILAVFNGRYLPYFEVGVASYKPGDTVPVFDENIPSKRTTFGHRFLTPEAFEVGSFADYERKLLEHHVVLDREKRKWRILGDIKHLADEKGLTLVHDEALLEEVAGLIEWPVALIGSIDADFMDLPPEVRRTTMRANQKYFTLDAADGKPAPYFALVANMETADGGAAIVAGNERVLRARLSDARFFYDQDRKTPLADLRPKLGKIVFHAKLGTVLDRVERMVELAKIIAPYVPGAEGETAMAVEAARLCKCDLVTGMVGEFPELQGVMGRYYALDENAPPHVADAIRDHYKPLGPNDACPTAPVSVVLALAEKIDALVGFFAIGETPTGSKDPFALRRAALGAIRLIVENGLRIPLGQIFELALECAIKLFTSTLATDSEAPENEQKSIFTNAIIKHFNTALTFNKKESKWQDLESELDYVYDTLFPETIRLLLTFFADRLKVALKERGVRHDLIDAVFALGGEDDLIKLLARVQALQDFLATDDGSNLLTAYRRAANILKIEEKRDGISYDGAPDPQYLTQVEELNLAKALDNTGFIADDLITREKFEEAMAAFATLRPVVDAFFEHVTVNADMPEIRANRLRLLSRIRGTLNKIADFSRIG